MCTWHVSACKLTVRCSCMYVCLIVAADSKLGACAGLHTCWVIILLFKCRISGSHHHWFCLFMTFEPYCLARYVTAQWKTSVTQATTPAALLCLTATRRIERQLVTAKVWPAKIADWICRKVCIMCCPHQLSYWYTQINKQANIMRIWRSTNSCQASSETLLSVAVWTNGDKLGIIQLSIKGNHHVAMMPQKRPWHSHQYSRTQPGLYILQTRKTQQTTQHLPGGLQDRQVNKKKMYHKEQCLPGEPQHKVIFCEDMTHSHTL